MEYDVVSKAETAIQSLEKDKFDKIRLTKTQIRKFLTAVNMLKNKVDFYKIKSNNSKALDAELTTEVKFLRVNILYQAGRERTVKDFVVKTDIERIIKDIGNDRLAFEKFCKYVEALVAFHKYYGGRDW